MSDKSYLIAEIGINHNGSLDTAKELIEEAVQAGFDAVKFQKRTVDVVYTAEELAQVRATPFGKTNGDYKRAIEFGQKEYEAINFYCAMLGIEWFGSAWDIASVDFLDYFNPPYHKVASASLTDSELLQHIASKGRPVLLSVGMSTLEEIDIAVNQLEGCEVTLMACNSSYPARNDELNLTTIETLRDRYDMAVGYSGHETGIATTVAARVLGASVIERHITLDRAMWGSDQAASLGVAGFRRLVRDIRAVESALGDGVKRVYPSELAAKDKLRRVG